MPKANLKERWPKSFLAPMHGSRNFTASYRIGNKKEIIKSLKMTPGYGEIPGSSPQQFLFTRAQAEEIFNFEQIGTLMIGEDYMKNAWSMYA